MVLFPERTGPLAITVTDAMVERFGLFIIIVLGEARDRLLLTIRRVHGGSSPARTSIARVASIFVDYPTMKRPSKKELLIQILKPFRASMVKRYPDLNPLWGGELLLPSEDTKVLIAALDDLGISILGMDGWRFWGDRQDAVVQALEVTHERDIDYPFSLIAFIDERVPNDIDFISLSLDVPVEWDLFSSAKWQSL